MLLSSWEGVNAVAQNKFRSSFHLLSQHLLAQSHQWRHQMIVWSLLKVKNKDTRLVSLVSFWCHYCYFQAYFSSLSRVFSVSFVEFEHVKPGRSSTSYHFKNCDVALLLFIKKCLIYCSQRQTQNLCHIQNGSFCKNSLQFKVVNIFNKKLHFNIYYGVLKRSWLFFQTYI